jgi:hypothetical protein
VVRAPSGGSIPFFEETGRKRSLPKDYVVAETGRYVIEIRSSAGGEGAYTLQVTPSWTRVVKLSAEASATHTFDAPAGATVSARTTSEGDVPTLAALRDPDGADLLGAPIVGRRRVAALPTTDCAKTGTYELDVSCGAATKTTLVRRAPKIPLVKLDARNGINGVSFESGGVKELFARRCAACHDWARGYNGVKRSARESLGKMRSGEMPKGGARIDAANLDLVRAWIEAGYPR